jgi:hypothetical protein
MKKFTVWSALALLVAATACEKKSPVAASTPQTGSSTATVVDATTGVTITTPALLSPADNAQIKNVDQPVTLVIGNAVSTSSAAMTYSFEVATDSAFSAKVYSKDGLAQGGNGQTSLTIDKIKPATTYFWRAHVNVGSAAGPNAKPRSFAIGPEVILQPPVLAAPGSNATVGGNATLTVNNVQRTGPAGQIFYLFQVADSSSFDNILFTTTVTEQGGSATSTIITANLGNGTYWWRVQASDPSNKVTTPFSVANPFKVQLFDMRNAVIYDNFPDVASWPETAKITLADTSGAYVIVDFDRRDGPNRWNDVGFGDGSLEYTLGACFNIDGQWYCSAAVQFWHGRELEAGGPVSQLAENWYYNPIRWGRMSGHQPAPGETIGLWVGQGNLRGGNGFTYKERSNVVLVPFGSTYSASALGRLPLSTPSIFNALQRPK